MNYSEIAKVYDQFVRSNFDIPFFLGEAKRSRGEILELMSGTGRISVPLIKAGHRLVCVDNSPEMIAVFRDRLKKLGLSAIVIEADIRELNVKRMFNLAIIPFNSFSELTSRPDQKKSLELIREHMTERGKLVIPLHNPGIRLKTVSEEPRLLTERKLEDGNTIKVTLSDSYDADAGIISGPELYEITGPDGGTVAKGQLDLSFYLFRKDEFEGLADSAGLKVAELYGGYDRSGFKDETSPYMIWTLVKK